MGVNSPSTAGLLYRISGPFESTYGLAQYVIGTWLAFPSWSVKLWASTVPRPGKKGPASEASGHQVRSPKGKPPFEPFSGPRIPPPPNEPVLASRPLLQDHPLGGRLPWEHTPLPKEGRQTLATGWGIYSHVYKPFKMQGGLGIGFLHHETF